MPFLTAARPPFPKMTILRFALPLLLCRAALAAAEPPATFCNPLNLDYGWNQRGYRHGADPVIVPFQGRYFLFSTWDVAGFRVSDDLINWTSHDFPADVRPLMTSGPNGYCAPAVAAQGEWLYFINMTPRPQDKLAAVMRTRDPLAGVWEKCGEIKKVKDPALFFDDDGRIWLYHGLGQPTRCFELDPQTFTEIPASERPVRPPVSTLPEFFGGYERGRREIFAETDTGPFLDHFKIAPCQEAAWMTKRLGRYYLQYATPGTVSQWYADTVMEGSSPLGPFHHVNYAPVSMKIGGFIGSAGHSGVFQDKHGNWWRVTTMWIGVHDLFERRLGLFPVGFDADGRMYTETMLGDYPQLLPAGPRREHTSPLAGWWVLSNGQRSRASSALPNHPPELAADENVRTWWSARTGRADEWFELDLGKPCRVNAVQVNFAEQDCTAGSLRLPDDCHRYRLLGSSDGQDWLVLADRSQNQTARPHDYVALAAAQTLRFLRIENLRMPAGGKFALRDLRVFGRGDDAPPPPVAAPQVTRHADDRNVTVRWPPVARADGYLVRFGPAPDKLWQCIQVQAGASSSLTFHALNRGVNYSWRVDAFNRGGVTPGR